MVYFSASQSKVVFSSEHAGWAEGSCVTSWRINEAVLRVMFRPQLGPRHFVITCEAVTSRSRSADVERPLSLAHPHNKIARR